MARFVSALQGCVESGIMLWFCYGSTASILCSNLLLSTAWMSGVSCMKRLHLSAELIPSAEGNEGLLSIQPSDYPALSQSGGSIRLGFNPIRSNHQPDGTLQPLLINRLEDGTLKAMSAECPHGSCAVRLQRGSQPHVCPCHASRFRLDGASVAPRHSVWKPTLPKNSPMGPHVWCRACVSPCPQVVDLGQSQLALDSRHGARCPMRWCVDDKSTNPGSA